MIRSAVSSDSAGILKVLSQAFNLKTDSEAYGRKKAQVLNDIGQWRIHEEPSGITAALHIQRDEMRIGEAVLIKGDVGEVSVLPECQGQGLGTRLMEDAIAWMRARDYDLSRLGGLTKFYARFGYVPFPRRYMEFCVGQTMGAGASQVTQNEIPLDDPHRRRIRRLDPDKDRLPLERLHDRVSRRYAASLVRIAPSAGPLALVYEDHGELAGWLTATEFGRDITEFEAGITIYALEYDVARPDALQSLMAYICNYALEKGIVRLTGRLPFDPLVRAALRATGIPFKEIETQGGIASSMLQVINLRSLLRHLAPELEARMAAISESKWSGTIEIDTGRGTASLRVDGGAIAPCDRSEPDLRIVVDEFHFMQMIMGLISFAELAAAGACPTGFERREKNLLAGLFPRRLVHSAVWG